MISLNPHRQKLKAIYENIARLQEQGRQNTIQYHQAYAELAQTYDQLMKLEQQAQQSQNHLFQQHELPQAPKLPPNNQILADTPVLAPSNGAELTWTEPQLEQLRNQILAYKSIVSSGNGTDSAALDDKLFQNLQLPAANWAFKQQVQQRAAMTLYEQKFEANRILYFHDLWEYVERKLSNGGQVVIKHPQAKDQHPSTSSKDAHHAYLMTKSANEIDHINDLSKQLERLIEDEYTPDKVRQQAQLYQRLIELRPQQQAIRDQLLRNFNANKEMFAQLQSKTRGDILYERQLVDRDFYKRAKVFTASKKEARTLDRFEAQMRSGQEVRRGARRKEFLKEVLEHSKEFWEFHKKRQKKLKNSAYSAKSYLDKIGHNIEKQKDKQERERIKALQANDMDAYLNLISTQKNSRLMNILDQTHNFLKQLGAKVIIQKQDNASKTKQREQLNKITDPNDPDFDKDNENVEGEEVDIKQTDAFGNKRKNPTGNSSESEHEEENQNKDAQIIKQNMQNSSKIYYKITHSIEETIEKQPSILVGGELKSYQMFGLRWMISLYNNNLNGILADEMGLGKTIQTIALFAYLIETKGNEGPFLIVVPLATITNWQTEFKKWAPSIQVVTYKGTKRDRPILAAHLKNDKYHVVLTTYEYILNDKATLCKIQWQYIIVDEGHRMRNTKSKFAMTLGQAYSSAHRILLTGTPLQNNLAELWSLLNFLLPKIFQSCEEFKKWFDKPLSKVHPVTQKQARQASDNTAYELTEEEQLLVINRLHQVLRPFLLRRVKIEVEKELPPKSELVIKVELSRWQQIVYNGITEKNIIARDPSQVKSNAFSLRNVMMQLRKIVNHPFLFEERYPEFNQDWIWKCSGKFELLDRILPKFVAMGHKVLIFSQFTQLIAILGEFLNYRGIQHLKLDGGMKQDDRDINMKIFNNPESEQKVFVLSTRAGGQGLNLQVANTVIIFDSDFNPQMDEQAKDRAHRIGQKQEVKVFRLITRSIVEEGILSRACSKKALDAKIIQAGMFNQKASEAERTNTLKSLIAKDYQLSNEEKAKKAQEENGARQNNGEPEENEIEEEDVTNEDEENEFLQDTDLNEILARNEQEFEFFQKMDQERYVRENKKERIRELEEKAAAEGIKLSKFTNYRLMQDFEVPQWVKDSIQVHVENEEEQLMIDYGLGKRKRGEVSYKENISDMQWLKIVEAGGDPQQEMERRKARARQAENGQNGHEGGDYGDELARNGAGSLGKYAEEYGDEDEEQDEDDDLDGEGRDSDYGKHR